MELFILNELKTCDESSKKPIAIDNEKFVNDALLSFSSDKNIYVISLKDDKDKLEYEYSESFTLSGIPNNNVIIINSANIVHEIDPEGIIILEDSPTTKMMDFINVNNLFAAIKYHPGTVIACGRSVKNLSKDVFDTKEQELYHDGLGMTRLTVEPNFGNLDPDSGAYKSVLTMSLFNKIYGLSEKSYIKIHDDIIEFIGDIKEIDDEKVKNISPIHKHI